MCIFWIRGYRPANRESCITSDRDLLLKISEDGKKLRDHNNHLPTTRNLLFEAEENIKFSFTC